jgi:nitrite reductase (NADH) small subunit
MIADTKSRAATALEQAATGATRWVDVCAVEDITPGTGVAALIAGEQVALIRPVGSSTIYALSNFDPFSKAFVISRGIVGDRNGVPKVASPIYKQNFSLETGQWLDDESVRLLTYETRVVQGRVHVKANPNIEEP